MMPPSVCTCASKFATGCAFHAGSLSTLRSQYGGLGSSSLSKKASAVNEHTFVRFEDYVLGKRSAQVPQLAQWESGMHTSGICAGMR